MKRDWKRILASTLILGLTLMSTGCGAEKPVAQAEEDAYIPVEVETAAIQTLVETTSFSGKIVSEQEVSVSPKMPGRVTTVNVEVGDRVDAGNVLFTLDSSDLSLDQATLNVQNAENTLSQAKNNLEQIHKQYDRTKQLFEAGAVSQVDLETVENQMLSLENAVATAQINLDLAKVNLQKVQEAVVTTAPSGGIVTAVNVKKGEMASNAMPAVTITNLNDIYVSINVPENIVNSIKVGQKATIQVLAAGDKEISGTIKSIAPSADLQTKLYPVKVAIPNPEGKIKPGMFATVEIPTKTKANVLTVKSDAVVLENGVDTIFIVEEDKAVAKEVVTGMDAGDYVEITEGLEEGAQVIIKGQTLVEDGAKIKVVGGSES